MTDDQLEEELRRTWEESDDDLDEDMDDYFDSSEDDDVIEVYNEDGELVCTYSAREYAEIKANDDL